MKKLKYLLFPTILVLAFGLLLSCAKSSEDNINDTVAATNDAIDEGVANTNENLNHNTKYIILDTLFKKVYHLLS